VSAAPTIQVIRHEAELEQLAPQWWELWGRVEQPTPFQSPAWLISWWKAFRPGELLSVAVWSGNRLVGLAPSYVEHASDRRRLLLLGVSISDYLDVLVDANLKQPVLARIASAYGAELRCWDEWELTELAPGSHACDLPCPDAYTEHRGNTATCPVLALHPSARGGVGPRARAKRKLSMVRNRVARSARHAIISAGERDTKWWLAELWRLHAARWSSRGERGLLTDPRLQQFQADALPELVGRRLARLYALELDGQIVGVYYGFSHCGRAYAYLGGFDPDFAYYSPGAFLLGHAMDQAAAEGAREFHLLRGGEAYKYAWGAEDRWNTRRVFTRAAS